MRGLAPDVGAGGRGEGEGCWQRGGRGGGVGGGGVEVVECHWAELKRQCVGLGRVRD